MITIELTQGKVALIDDEDFERVSKFKWTYFYNPHNKKQYARRGVGGRRNQKTVYMHRFIMDAPKGLQVDHINGDGLNNQKHNLRLATNAQNHQNQVKSVASKSGFKGVSIDKKRNNFYARIQHNQHKTHLGYFQTAFEAAAAYDEAAIKYHGEFARLNFPCEGYRTVAGNDHAASALSLHIGLARRQATA